MNYNLYQHQKDAVRFAKENNCNIALLHEPGLGKTLTSLEIFSYLRQTYTDLKMFIICPLSLIKPTWGADIQKFTALSYKPFKELKNEFIDITSINFESLISKNWLPKVKQFIQKYPCLCIIDESSKMKDNRSKTTKTLLTISHHFKKRIILSGTPSPNSFLELWPQISFIRPGALFPSFYQFRNRFFHLENKDKEVFNAKILNKSTYKQVMMQGFKYTINKPNSDKILSIIKPFTHWRKAEDCLDLPKKITQIRDIYLSGEEVKIYKDLKYRLMTELGGLEITGEVALKKIMKLRQCTSGFLYDDTRKVAHVKNPTKLKELKQVLSELGDKQIIICINFLPEVEDIKELLKDKTVSILAAGHGNREDEILKFQKGESQYMILNPASGGHGLTFVNCNTMIFYSLSYSNELHEQVQKRIHRIGQTKTCNYIYLLAPKTIDEQIYQAITKKQNLKKVIYEFIKN